MYGKKQAVRKKNVGLSQSTNSINYTCKPNFCNEKVWLIEKFG